jgi:thioredoxin 1
MSLTDATPATYNELTGTGVVLVDFWAPWCGPCTAIAPTLTALAADGHQIVKVNVDDHPSIAQQHQISSIPTLLILRDGVLINRHTGAAPRHQIEQLLGAA